MKNMEELRQQLKTAAADLRDAQDVIYRLAEQVHEGQRKIAARDVALKLVGTGQLPVGDVSVKVAELETQPEEVLAQEQKLASFGASRHNLLPGGAPQPFNLNSFIS